MVALFVVMTIVVFVVADSVVQWRKARGESEARRLAEEIAPATKLEKLTAPPGVYLDGGHTWVQVSPTGRADVGVDSFAQTLIGHVDAVDLPEVGKRVNRGDVLFALRQGKHRAAFASPVDGFVTTVDTELAWHPEMIQSDPYGEGWVCSLSPRDLARNLKQLRLAEDGRAWLKDEAQRFQEFFAARPLEDTRLGQILQDGGQPTGGVLELAGDGTWKQFNEIFLRPRASAGA